nr:SDR family NAD(P)-dependent oxidoreductase [Thetidibacter halocola]
MRPEDGTAIVTGAGSGLGQAMAVALTRRGFNVAGTGRRADALADTAALCPPDRFTPLPLDVGDAEAVAQAFAGIRPIALLVNNAAVYPQADFAAMDPQDFMAVVNTNLGGVVNCCHAALQDMCARGQGRILNVATFADLHPLPAASAYSVSKGAARILTRALIADLGDRFPEIVIGDWMPGSLATGMGIPDGLPPEVAAEWGIALALRRDPTLTGAVFEMDREILPPRGLKRRVKDALLFRRQRPRRL